MNGENEYQKTPDCWPKEEDGLNRFLNSLPYLVGIIAIILISACVLSFYVLKIESNIGEWGAFTDYLGGILNPLISTFTLLVAIKVWNLQKSELSETRMELSKQRNQQRFFDLLEIYNQVISNLGGKSNLSKIRHELESRGNENIEQGDWCPILTRACGFNDEAVVLLRSEWKDSEYGQLYANYFLTIAAILEEAPDLLGNELERYIRLFRLQLSHDELVLIAYFVWLDENGHGLLVQCKRYGLLKNLHLTRIDNFKNFLPASVFGIGE